MPLRADQLRIEIGPRVLLRGASFVMQPGEKVALVGRNGAGKTTLLKTVAGEMAPASGWAKLPEHWGWLPQDTSAPVGEDILAYDYLLGASRLSELKHQMDAAHKQLEDPEVQADGDALESAVHIYSESEEAFRLGGGYELESEAERIAAGVGLDEEALLQELPSLSGGQRRRLELARLLLRGGELLILDEPTNHLDVEAKAFVMKFLRTTESAVLVVSHDIELMNESIDRVFVLENAQIDIYKGTYSSYLKQRDEREAARQRVVTNAQREVARLERTKEIFRRADETSSRKRKQFEARIEKIKEEHLSEMPTVRRRNLKIRFPDPVRAGDVVIRAEGLAKGFDGQDVFSDVDFIVERGEAFIVIGRNGAGKTTLLRTIASLYAADAGTVQLGANVTLGFYAQEHEDIPEGPTVLELINEASGSKSTETQLRSILGHFGLSGDVASQEAASLSGGEKTKLSLARLVAGKANVLLLDEPTNNLDVQSREALAGALQHYKGTVVLVSHDLEFVTQLAPKRAIVMPEGRLLPFDEEMLELVPAT